MLDRMTRKADFKQKFLQIILKLAEFNEKPD